MFTENIVIVFIVQKLQTVASIQSLLERAILHTCEIPALMAEGYYERKKNSYKFTRVKTCRVHDRRKKQVFDQRSFTLK